MTDKRDIKTRMQAWFGRPFNVQALIEQSQDVNGYIREPAVRKLGEIGDAAALPYLIVRANDWVPQVRDAAYAALLRLLTPYNVPAFVANLSAIVRLEDCGRANHRALIGSIVDFLALAQHRDDLLRCIDHPDARVASLAMRVAIDRKYLSDAELIDKGLAHARVNVRAMAIDLLRKLEPQDFDRMIQRALRDPFMPVRREALQQLLRRNAGGGLSAARTALFDRTPGVRTVALKALIAAGEPVEDMLAARLQMSPLNASTVNAVLWGWGEIGARARGVEVASWVRDTRPSVRRVALVALAKLTGQECREVLDNALSDAAPSVCNEAARLICAHDIDIGPDRLTSISLAHPVHVVRACARVMDARNKWDRLGFILDVYGRHDSDEVRAEFNRVLGGWNGEFNRSAAQPSPLHHAKLRASLDRCAALIDRESLETLRFTFRTNRIGR